MIPSSVSPEIASRGLQALGWRVMKDEGQWVFYINPTYPDDPASPLFLSFHDGDIPRAYFNQALRNAGIDPDEFAAALSQTAP